MTILLIGDSHCKWLNINNCKEFVCSAGSAKGLNNKISISNYHNLILEKMRDPNTFYNTVIFMFGSVDLDFCHIHKLIDNPRLNIYEFIDPVIHSYVDFIKENFSDKRVIVLSVGLPTLDDENLKEGLLNAHINGLENVDVEQFRNRLKCVNLPDIYTRTNYTRIFNYHLKDIIEKCGNPNLQFLDITSFSYDEEKQRIKDEFFTKIDHHCYDRNNTISSIINDFLYTFGH
jgi:hypothetical protein